MKPRTLSTLIFCACLALYTVAFLGGVASVPYHPDESSYLFMSDELEPMLTHPSSLYWSERPADGKRQSLRLLNPPLIHIVVELGRRAAGLDPLPVDWNWSAPWDYNLLAGAVPSPALLQAGRMAVAVLFPLSLVLFFFAARRAAGDFTAWAAVVLLASNALLLLHARRVMAEGTLIFAVALFLWTMVVARQHPWLAAIPAALAVCAKLSLAPLVLIGLAAILWPLEAERPAALRARQAVVYAALGLALTLALYPIAWQQPLRVAEEISRTRDYVANIQMQKYADQVIKTPGERLRALVRQVYFAPPDFYEDPMYAAQTRDSETAYLANPLHRLLRSGLGGGILLALTLAGLGLCLPRMRRELAYLLAATLLLAFALLAAVPLEWQRYYLPLLPFTCFWAAYALDQARVWIRRAQKKGAVMV